VRIHEDTGTAEVIVPDYQLSLAIGKEGQNARLAARLTGWRVDIKSETQLAEEAAYQTDDWAQGEWIVHPETGEQMWQPADGTPAMTAEEWSQLGAEQAEAEDAEAGTEGEAAPTDAVEAGEVADAPAEDVPAEDVPAAEPAEGTDEVAEAEEGPTEADVGEAPADEVAEASDEDPGEGDDAGTEDASADGADAADDGAPS
jgi:N utilization substance protein A